MYEVDSRDWLPLQVVPQKAKHLDETTVYALTDACFTAEADDL
jgi:hypothetical protein